MRKEIKALLTRADEISRQTEQVLREAWQCIFDLWELILEDEGLGLIN